MLLKYLIINSDNMELLSQLGMDGTDGTMDGEETGTQHGEETGTQHGEETGTQHGDGTEPEIEMEMEDIEETDGQQRALVWK